MITLGLQLNSSLLAGLTFSIEESRVDNVEIIISNLGSLASQFVNMMMQNETEQDVKTGTMTEDFSEDVDLEIVLQSNSSLDISSDLNKHCGIKTVEVELLT